MPLLKCSNGFPTILLWPIYLRETCPSLISCSRQTTFSYAPGQTGLLLDHQAAPAGCTSWVFALPSFSAWCSPPRWSHLFFLTVFRSCSNTILLEKTFLITYMKEHKPSPHLALFFLWHLLPLTQYIWFICLLSFYPNRTKAPFRKDFLGCYL